MNNIYTIGAGASSLTKGLHFRILQEMELPNMDDIDIKDMTHKAAESYAREALGSLAIYAGVKALTPVKNKIANMTETPRGKMKEKIKDKLKDNPKMEKIVIAVKKQVDEFKDRKK